MLNRAYLDIMAGAALWGMIGVFFNSLSALGLSPMQIVALRMISAALAFLLYLAATHRLHLLKFNPRDSIYFVGTGVFSLIFFNWCYFNTIEKSSLAVAAILLYTSPVWITLLAALFLGEKFTLNKLPPLLLTMLGCVLVTGIFGDNTARISPITMLLGLGSGFGYALYSIFGKFALAKYPPLTVNAHTFIFGAIGSLPFLLTEGWHPAYSLPQTWIYVMGIGIFCCVVPYVLYTRGLNNAEAGKAAVLATVEPAVAAMFSIFLYHEPLSVDKLCGILLIFAAVILLNLSPRKTKST